MITVTLKASYPDQATVKDLREFLQQCEEHQIAEDTKIQAMVADGGKVRSLSATSGVKEMR